jgi:small subunit ribosomal protein S2
MREDGRFDLLTKKERLGLDRQHEGLMKNLAGIKDMNGLPDMLFVIDVRKEDIAIAEANRLNIPVVAVVDTNCSPDGIDQIIPGNDDALRAIRLFASRIADAILEGQTIASEGSVGAIEGETSEAETGDENDGTAAVEPTVQVADQSFATADATNIVSPEAEHQPTGTANVDGATGNSSGDELAEVETDIPRSATEKVTRITEKSSAAKEPVQEEATEATAS